MQSVSKEVKTMANIKSQIKRVGTNEKARLRNVNYKTQIKTASKKVVSAVNAGDKVLAQNELNAANRLIDKSVSKGITHYRTAARQKSHLAGLVNSIN
jgi:small subunit ribosomal protein S20